jgi:putative membrane protein
MAAVGIGLGFNALFQALQPPWVAKAIASSFLLIAVLVFVSAERRACTTLGRLDSHQIKELKPMRIRLLAWLLITATLALLVAIWVAA